ncbi:hypothetical protein B0H11DRAFT_1966401 [Mycena galericulata]|nr:hypothetical protein B0H11DRAFT_1966401 [Mycena galericulata]
MSSFPGASQEAAQNSYYPNAIYQGSAEPPPFPVNNDNLSQTADPPRACSVRGCLNPVEPPSPNAPGNKKMCAACREKHRVYASTKRARRKAEKTLVDRMSATTAGTHLQDPEPLSWTNQESQEGQPTVTVAQYASPGTSSLSNAFAQQSQNWSPAIDPALYSQPGPSSSSSSTLAGALTLQPSTNTSTNVPTPSHVAPSSIFSRSDEEVHTSGNADATGAGPVEGGPVGINASGPSGPSVAVGAAATHTSNDRPRFCSVKGCKAIIIESTEDYPYKMCQSCRTRYRNYGITKRAKWKAEREAYDRELESARSAEDIRRAENGLPPLSESPEELRAWELSIIDEQVPLPPSHQSSVRGPVPMPMGPLDTRYSHQVPPDVPLPARMCTVSHCHKILPGFYRYKRCEIHRLQNRWHGKLKRGREKIEKGFVLPDGTPLVAPGPIKTKSNAEPKVKKARKKREAKDKEPAGTEGASGSGEIVEDEGGEVAENNSAEQSLDNVNRPLTTTQRRSKSQYSCRQDDCCNLIAPGTRWRTCDSCRAQNRSARQEKKATENPQLQSDPFVNITVDAPNNPNVSDSTTNPASGSGSSTAIHDASTSIGVPDIDHPGHTSTSTLSTMNEPPPDNTQDANKSNTAGVRLVRKYKRLPRYDKSTSATEASSSTTRTPPTVAPIPATHPAAYAYPPPPPGAYPYPYMPPPGYYGMPPPPGSAAPGQPPLMYMPSPYPYAMMPPANKADTAPSGTPGPPSVSYPYYPYPFPPPGYPQHYPRTSYAPYPYPNVTHPNSPQIAGNPTPYAVYKFHSTPPAAPPPPPAAGTSQGYTYYQFKNGLKTPDEQGRKRRRLSEEVELASQQPGQHVFRISPPPKTNENVVASAVAPPADAPVVQESAAQPEPMVVDPEAREIEQFPTAAEAPSQRLCGSKACNRPLVGSAGGLLCEKCRTKMKKRQTMTKQRFKLEPKKIASAISLVMKH